MAATPEQLKPLEVDAVTGHCFIRLPPPHANIYIVPTVQEHAVSIQSILSDPNVNRWLSSVPVPYTMHHAEDWIALTRRSFDTVMAQLAAGDKFVDSCPVRSIVERQDDGTMQFIGDISLRRATEPESIPGGYEENMKRPPGDPQIYWGVGYYLKPSHQGRGIMSAVLGALLTQWAIPRMGARKIVGSTFDENERSRRVFEKNGFKFRETVPNGIVFRGEPKNLHLLDWEI